MNNKNQMELNKLMDDDESLLIDWDSQIIQHLLSLIARIRLRHEIYSGLKTHLGRFSLCLIFAVHRLHRVSARDHQVSSTISRWTELRFTIFIWPFICCRDDQPCGGRRQRTSSMHGMIFCKEFDFKLENRRARFNFSRRKEYSRSTIWKTYSTLTLPLYLSRRHRFDLAWFIFSRQNMARIAISIEVLRLFRHPYIKSSILLLHMLS